MKFYSDAQVFPFRWGFLDFGNRISAILVVSVLLLPCVNLFAVPDAIAHYLTAVKGIQSYDVYYRHVDLDYSDFDNLAKPDAPVEWDDASTNRQVFAKGLGWRFEQQIGTTNHIIGVLNLQGAPVEESKPKNDYSDFLNPVIGTPDMNLEEGYQFLTDLMTDTNSSMEQIGIDSSNSHLFGFEVNNPKLRGNYLRVWLDAEHGYLVSKAEWYLKTQSSHGMNRITLSRVMQVDKFEKADGQLWIPLSGSISMISPAGKFKGRAIMGWKMDVDLQRSSWNSIKTDDLFLASSMPEVNSEKNGWKFDYPPVIAALHKELASGNAAHRSMKTGLTIVLWAAISAGCLFVLIMVQRKGKMS